MSKPSGVVAGDVLLAQIAIFDGTGSNVPTAPTNWTVIRHDSIGTGNKITSWLYFKVAGASEPSSYSWTIASQYAAGIMGAWSGVASSPIDTSSGTGSASGSPITASAPSLTPAQNSELQVYFYGSQNSAAPTITEPTAITQRANSKSTLEGFTLAFADLAAPSRGIGSTTYAAKSTSVLTAQAVLLEPSTGSAPSVAEAGKLVVAGTLSFGRSRVGTLNTKRIVLKNRGKGLLTGTIPAMVGVFTISPAGSFVLRPGESLSAAVVFHPNEAGKISSDVGIGVDAPSQPSAGVTVRLSGTGK